MLCKTETLVAPHKEVDMRISYVEYEVDRDVGAEKLEIDSNLGFIRLQWVWDTQNTNVGSSKHVSIKCLIF